MFCFLFFLKNHTESHYTSAFTDKSTSTHRGSGGLMSAFIAGNVGQITSRKSFWHHPRIRAAAGVRGAARGRPGEQQARLIRQGPVLSAQPVLSLLTSTDIVQTPANSKKEGTVSCLYISFMLWNCPDAADMDAHCDYRSHLKDIGHSSTYTQ